MKMKLFNYISGSFFIYVAFKFARMIALFSLIAAGLIFLFDFLELFRRASGRPDATLYSIGLMSVLRVPSLFEQTIPFIALLGSITAFLNMSRHRELVVARAAGLSAWQFIFPGMLVSAIFGIFMITCFNPLSVIFKQASDEIGLRLFGSAQLLLNQSSRDTWIRHTTGNRQAILRVDFARQDGRMAFGLTFFIIDEHLKFSERIEAQSGQLSSEGWLLKDVRRFPTHGGVVHQDLLTLKTNLTPELIRERFTAADNVSFWSLPLLISRAEQFGLPAYRYRLQQHILLALPLLLCAMVLIAGNVSLGSLRVGVSSKLIFGGISAGFVLYVSIKIAKDVGGVGLVSPALAAWSPSVIATLVGITVLLYQEDG